MLAPETESVPVPDLVSGPVPETTPDQVELKAPEWKVPPPVPNVRPRAELIAAVVSREAPPLRETVFERFPIAVSEARETVPAVIEREPVQVFTPPRVNVPAPAFVNVPEPETIPFQAEVPVARFNVPPEPARVRARAEVIAALANRVPPWRVTPPAALPRRLSLAMETVPALRVRPPRKVFTPPRVSVPVPVLVSEPAPLITPFQVELRVPAAKVPPEAPKTIDRAEVKPVVVERMPPLRVSGPAALPSRASLETARVPPWTVMPPVRVLLAPRVSVPVPSFTRLPFPAITELSVVLVPLWLTVRTVLLVRLSVPPVPWSWLTDRDPL